VYDGKNDKKMSVGIGGYDSLKKDESNFTITDVVDIIYGTIDGFELFSEV
jgi:hypothetical protein